MKRDETIYSLIFLTVLFLMSSCEPISYKDYQMEPYSGAFTWQEVLK